MYNKEEFGMEKHKLLRISELSKKSRTAPLSPEELAEQKALREEYLAAVKRNFRMTLESIEFVDKK